MGVGEIVEKTYATPCGAIHYWIHTMDSDATTLVFLPGLTADHRLFEKQIEYFQNKYNVFVWDAPAHAASWPFEFDFDLFDKAKWLNGIFEQEKITKPVIVGQSMGGYVGQVYAERYPERLQGFISIDSAPLQRKYVTRLEIWLLKRMEPVYLCYPWKYLLKSGTTGVAVSEYGKTLMYDMMMVYDGDKKRYARIAGHGFKILANAMERDLPYAIRCPALLICGEQDRAGSCIRYNKAWNKNTGIPLEWIKEAGHNANTDKPETVNQLIEKIVEQL
jgi:pimeloyl-ACP methyl ester carboxylesterase